LKIGGPLSNFKTQLTVNIEENNIQLPFVMGAIRGTAETENFIMIGYQLGATQQNKIINEIIQAFTNQIKNGWKPRLELI